MGTGARHENQLKLISFYRDCVIKLPFTQLYLKDLSMSTC